MRENIKRVTHGVLIAVLASTAIMPSVSAASKASAQQAPSPFNYAVTPSSQNLEVEPGDTITTTIRIQNNGTSSDTIQVSLNTFAEQGIHGIARLLKPSASADYTKWVQFSTSTFTAPPGAWVPVTVTISPPKTAAYGYYYAVVFSRQGSNNAEHGQTNLAGSIASLILLNVVAPGAKQHTDIDTFSTPHNVSEFLPVSFLVRMHNKGNVHVAPWGNIFITKGGQQVALLHVNDGRGEILPNSYREFTASWNSGSPVYQTVNKNGKQERELNWNNFNLGNLRFGHYKATLAMVYPNGKQGATTDQASLSFWVIPWRILAGVLVVLLLVLVGLWAIAGRPFLRRYRGNQRPKGIRR